MLSKHKFVVDVLDATRRGRTHGVLSIVTVKGKKVKTSRLRAIVRVTGVKSRVYGERRLSALQAVRSVLSMMTKKINRDEIKRVLVAVQAVHGAGIGDSQDSNPKCVQIIHQIYGVFRDDKPMPDLFQKSLSEVQQTENGHYKWMRGQRVGLKERRSGKQSNTSIKPAWKQKDPDAWCMRIL